MEQRVNVNVTPSQAGTWQVIWRMTNESTQASPGFLSQQTVITSRNVLFVIKCSSTPK